MGVPSKRMTDTSAATRSPHFTRDATVQTYTRIHLPRVFVPWARVLLEVVPPRPGDAVLDVATGPGTVARHAAELVGASGHVTGVDISAAMLSAGRAGPAEPGAAPIEYVESSATQQQAIREAMIRALEPLVKDGAVHLRSASNIAAASTGPC
jgi:SAM-dependent methyltransferase